MKAAEEGRRKRWANPSFGSSAYCYLACLSSVLQFNILLNRKISTIKPISSKIIHEQRKKLLILKTWIIWFQTVVSTAGTPPLLWEPDTLSQNQVPLQLTTLLEGQEEAFLNHANFKGSWSLSHFPTTTNTILRSLLSATTGTLHYSVHSCYSGFPNTASPLCLQPQVKEHMGHQMNPFSTVSH